MLDTSLTLAEEKGVEKKERKRTTPHKYGKMLSRYGLTKKQEKFVTEYIYNGGNGMRAVMAAYDVTNENVACAMSSENLSKQIIRETIQDILFKQLATPEFAAAGFVRLASQSDDEKIQHKALESVAKMNGMFRAKTDVTHNVNVVSISLPPAVSRKIMDVSATELGEG